MPSQPKPKSRPVGRPKLAKGEAKGKLVALRLRADLHGKIAKAATVNNTSVSDWIRSTLEASLG